MHMCFLQKSVNLERYGSMISTTKYNPREEVLAHQAGDGRRHSRTEMWSA